MPTKYTKNKLAPLVKKSVSVSQVLDKLGVSVKSGGMHSYISKKITEYNLDTKHFLGQRTNSGENHVGGNKKLSANEILVLSDKKEELKHIN